VTALASVVLRQLTNGDGPLRSAPHSSADFSCSVADVADLSRAAADPVCVPTDLRADNGPFWPRAGRGRPVQGDFRAVSGMTPEGWRLEKKEELRLTAGRARPGAVSRPQDLGAKWVRDWIV